MDRADAVHRCAQHDGRVVGHDDLDRLFSMTVMHWSANEAPSAG